MQRMDDIELNERGNLNYQVIDSWMKADSGGPENIAEEHICPICLELFYKPIRISSCQKPHRFCQNCLYDFAKAKRNRMCPVCRREYHPEQVKADRDMWNYLNTIYPRAMEKRKLRAEEKTEIKYVVGNMAEGHRVVEGRAMHRWTFYMREVPGGVPLRQVADSVEVKLHPTFAPSELTFDLSRGEEVEITRIGYGTFKIEAKIKWKPRFRERVTELVHELSWNPVTEKRYLTKLSVK